MCAKLNGWVVIWAPMLALLVAGNATAQPTQKLRVALDAWASAPMATITPEAKPTYAAALGDLRAAQEGVLAIARAQQANKMGGLAPTVFTKVTAALAGLNWRARYLVERGEPCGVELNQRWVALKREFDGMANIYRNGSKGQVFNHKAAERFGSNLKQRQAAYKKAQEMVMRGKFAECETFVLKTYQQWFLEIGLMQNIGGYTKDFNPALANAQTAMTAKRRNEGAAALVKIRQSVLPNVDQTLAATAKIVDDITQSGTSTISGANVDGPGAFDQVARFWKITHWNLHKAEAVQMALCGMVQRDLAELAMIRAEHKKLTDGMVKALADIIAGDTDRANQELLNRYLQSAAAIRVDAQYKTLSKVDQALGQMAVKLHGDGVGDLNMALNDLLRWRSKSADARAAALQASGFVDSQQSIILAAQSTKTMHGIITIGGKTYPQFLGCGPEIVTLGEPAGRKVSLDFVAPSSPTATVRISRLHDRVYATLPPTWDIDDSMTQLKSDLLITDQLPPLTLTATSSVHAGSAGFFRRVGGVVKGAYPKSLVVEKALLPAVSWNMIPLGRMAEMDTTDYLPQAVMHVDVTPAWFQHEHFLAPAKQAGETAAGG